VANPNKEGEDAMVAFEPSLLEVYHQMLVGRKVKLFYGERLIGDMMKE